MIQFNNKQTFCNNVTTKIRRTGVGAIPSFTLLNAVLALVCGVTQTADAATCIPPKTNTTPLSTFPVDEARSHQIDTVGNILSNLLATCKDLCTCREGLYSQSCNLLQTEQTTPTSEIKNSAQPNSSKLDFEQAYPKLRRLTLG